MRTPSRLRTFAATAALATLLAACGGGTDAEDVVAEPTAEETMGDEMSDEMASEDMDDMDDMGEGMSEEEMGGDGHMGDEMGGMAGMMGSADVTPADEAGGELVQGEFAVLDSAPDDVSIEGTALLARTDDGTVVTLRLSGLEAGKKYVSHVHADSCANDGGPHYMHDPEGDVVPPNEIHLAFTADDNGEIEWSVENEMVANDDAVSVVVHEDVDGAPKLACADLA